MASFSRLGIERISASLIPTGIGAVLLHTALRGFGVGRLPAAGMSIAAALAGTIWLKGRLPSSLDGVLRRQTTVAILWFAFGVVAIGTTARLSSFMIDESRAESSIYSFDDFFVHHSCLSAHYQSARLHRAGVPNVYERTLYEGPGGEPKFINSFVIDVFLYPPPMLLISRLALSISEDFAAWRAVWFAVEGAIVGLALLAIASWIGGPQGQRATLLALLVWLSFPTLLTLQIGNLHLAAVAIAMLAMLAFERERHAVGGALLAAIVLFKIFPGILILLLLFQRRWRSLAWSVGFGMLLVLIAVLMLGTTPFQALFSYQLPRLSTGAAFESLFAHPDVIAANQSAFGFVQKLSLLGVPGMSLGTAAVVTWVYTLLLIGLTAFGAKVAGEKHSRALVWIALIQLASLRSPFTPDTYAGFPLLWMLVLHVAGGGWQGWRTIPLASLILLANFVLPAVPIMPMTWLLVLTLTLQALFFAYYQWVLLAQPRASARLMAGRSSA